MTFRAAQVLIPPELRDDWLNPRLDDLDQVRDMLAAVPQSPLHPYEISTKANKPGNNGPELITPV